MQFFHGLIELPIAQHGDYLHSPPDRIVYQILIFTTGTLKHIIDNRRPGILRAWVAYTDTQTPEILGPKCRGNILQSVMPPG